MTNDLISRQAAIDALSAILDNQNHAEFLYGDEICKTLQDLPSADVAPVRHGKWIDITDSHIGTCSLCGDRWGSVDMMNYCPNCGARMDGDEDEID